MAKKPISEKISRKEARDALLRSGYLLENRLDSVLREKEYLVDANKAYQDPDTGKPRELDLYAGTVLSAGKEKFDWLVPVLLIECVNNPQPVAFITKEPQQAFIHQYDVRYEGIPTEIPDPEEEDSWQFLVDYLDMEKYHHYCTGRVATQYCTFRRKEKKPDAEWMAWHDEVQHEFFQKLCASLEYFAKQHDESWLPGDEGEEEYVNLEFYYPVLVLQGELLEVRPGDRGFTLVAQDHIQYRRSSVVGKESTDYQIDVVTEAYFPKYLDIVRQEMEKTARILRRRYKTVIEAVDKMAARRTEEFKEKEAQESAEGSNSH